VVVVGFGVPPLNHDPIASPKFPKSKLLLKPDVERPDPRTKKRARKLNRIERVNKTHPARDLDVNKRLSLFLP